MCEDNYDPDYDFDEDLDDGEKPFGPDYQYGGEECYADPTGHSALRCATKTNPRNLPCPTCGAENVLTQRDVNLGYQCDSCADRAENPYLQY